MELGECEIGDETRKNRQNQSGWGGIQIPATFARRAVTRTSADSSEGLPDFALVVNAWPELPAPIRAAIMAMIQATSEDVEAITENRDEDDPTLDSPLSSNTSLGVMQRG